MSVDGSLTLEALTATGGIDVYASISLDSLSASGTSFASGATGSVTLEALSATGDTVETTFAATGSPSFSVLVAVGTAPPNGSVAFEVATSTGWARGPTTGEAMFEPMLSVTTAGFVSIQTAQAVGSASAAVQATFKVVVMNTRTKGVTEYESFPFTSFARTASGYLAVGEDGLVLLGGATDDGTAIPWSMRTGQMDEGNVNLKRLPEVILGMRSNGDVLVRVHSDDNTHNDYNMAAVKKDTIYQNRVKPGKGLRSRWYSIELQGVAGSDIELTSMQVNMVPVERRLG